jgi:hypothetical protein
MQRQHGAGVAEDRAPVAAKVLEGTIRDIHQYIFNIPHAILRVIFTPCISTFKSVHQKIGDSH